MRAAGNYLGEDGGAAVGRSLTALTGLQRLDLSCKALCFLLLFALCFERREGCCREGSLGVGSLVFLMRVAGNDLGADGGAAVGRSLTALTGLQTLDLSSQALCLLLLFAL